QARGPIRLFGHDLTLNAAVTATGNGMADQNRIELHASGNVTQTAAMSAYGLSLHGNGRFALEHSGNTVSVLAAGSGAAPVGRLSYVNANTLSIGSVSGVSGVNASGTVSVATVAGDL